MVQRKAQVEDIDAEIIAPRKARRNTRQAKQESGVPIKPKKESFIAQNNKGVSEFAPTASQRALTNKIRQNTLTVIDSEAGTGKSSAVLWHFCKEYIANNNLCIYVIRTPVEAGDDKIGFLPFSESEKLAVHFASARVLLEKFLGKGRVADDMEKRIFFKAPNYMLGHTIDNGLVLIDESQQISPLTMKLLLERIGKETKVVVAGCSSQIYSTDKKRNALADAINRFFTEDKEPKYADMAYHEFDIEECHRADIVKDVIRAYRGI
jgi:phosphate starvation-inducible protein PhoH and related proteins